MLIRKVRQPHFFQPLLERKMLNIHLGQAISKNSTGKERRTGMLRSSGDMHPFKFCGCGVFEVRRIRAVVSTALHLNLLPLASDCTAK